MEKKPNLLYKSRLFVMIFEDRKNLLGLAVLMPNINEGHNPDLMGASHILWVKRCSKRR